MIPAKDRRSSEEILAELDKAITIHGHMRRTATGVEQVKTHVRRGAPGSKELTGRRQAAAPQGPARPPSARTAPPVRPQATRPAVQAPQPPSAQQATVQRAPAAPKAPTHKPAAPAHAPKAAPAPAPAAEPEVPEAPEEGNTINIGGQDVTTTEARDDDGTLKRHWIDKNPTLPDDTQLAYSRVTEQGARVYSQERVNSVHEPIFKAITEKVVPVKEGETPRVILMMGGTASGKSTIRGAMALDERQFVMLDADLFKSGDKDHGIPGIPEYQKALASGKKGGLPVTAKNAAHMAQEESSFLSNTFLHRITTARERRNVIVDGTGSNQKKYSDLVDTLHARGYHVTVSFADVDMEEAKSRAKARATKTGRWVEEEIIEENHRKCPANFYPVSQKADSFSLWDNRQRPPKLVWGSENGNEIYKDSDAINAFKARADILRSGLKKAGVSMLRKAIEDAGEPKQAAGKNAGQKYSISLDEINALVLKNFAAVADRDKALPATFPDNEGLDPTPEDWI